MPHRPSSLEQFPNAFSLLWFARFLTCCFKASLTLFEKILGLGSQPLYLPVFRLLPEKKIILNPISHTYSKHNTT